MSDRKKRLETIRKIVTRQRVESQQALAGQLMRQGFSVTQATLSRDLKELGVAKHPDGGGTYIYQLSDANGVSGAGYLAAFVRMEFSGSFGLIRTLPGHAMSVAAVIDGMELDVVLGTIAGDDTILVLPRDGATKAAVLRAFRSELPALRDRIG